MRLMMMTLVTLAFAGDTSITATKSVETLKTSDGYVKVGTVDQGRAGTLTLECKLAKETLGCRTATKAETERVEVTSVDAKAGRFTVAVDGTKVNVDIQGDLVGIRPDPWAE